MNRKRRRGNISKAVAHFHCHGIASLRLIINVCICLNNPVVPVAVQHILCSQPVHSLCIAAFLYGKNKGLRQGKSWRVIIGKLYSSGQRSWLIRRIKDNICKVADAVFDKPGKGSRYNLRCQISVCLVIGAQARQKIFLCIITGNLQHFSVRRNFRKGRILILHLQKLRYSKRPQRQYKNYD